MKNINQITAKAADLAYGHFGANKYFLYGSRKIIYIPLRVVSSGTSLYGAKRARRRKIYPSRSVVLSYSFAVARFLFKFIYAADTF